MTKVKQITRIAYKVPPTGFSTFDVEYYLSTSTTALAGGSWQTTPPAWVEGRYMWTRTKVVKTDGTTTYSDPVCIGGTGRGIRSIQEQYYLSTSNTDQTGGSWANSPQTWVDGKYMWTRSVITYTDGTTVTTDPVCVTGGKGATGDPGKGVSSITEYYLATSADSGVTRSTSGWTTSIQSLTATKKYLWNYEAIAYTDNTTLYTNPHIIGVYGDQGNPGKGISSVTNYYLATASGSGVTTSTSGWTTSIQSPTASKKYLWNYEVITYTDNTTTTIPPHIIGVYGDKGDQGDEGNEGKSFVPVYKNWDTKPATPTGSTMPPAGWRTNVENSISGLAVSAYDTSVIPASEQLRDSGGNLIVGTQDCVPISFTLGQENVEYGVPYYVLPGYEVDENNVVSHIDSGCAIARIDFTTSIANQQIRVELLSSSEANYDYIMLGKLDSTLMPSKSSATSYSGRASGLNVKVAVDLMVPTAGNHFVYVVYRKDSSTSKFEDRGCFRVADLSETLWMSIATMRGEAVLSWGSPIKMTAGRGERGAVPRMRNFAEGLLFMEGKAGEAYLDFAFFNNRFYKCTKTHVSQVGETPYAEVQGGTGIWALETDYQFIASKVVWVGNGAQGWMIDEGRIYHSSGLIELNADGTIQTSNGKFKVTKEGKIVATDGEFTGKVTASSGQIAGFKISGNGLTNDPFTNDAYVIFRNDSQGAFAGIGGNVLPASTGARAVGRFENHDNDDLWGLGVNYGILVSARNGGENRAIQIDGGCLTGLALRNTIIGNSVTSKTLGRYDCHVICINSNDCTITLPTMQLYDSGHVIKVKWLGGKVKFNVSYCYTPNGSSYRYTRPCIIYGSNDTIAPGNTLDYSNAGCGCDFIWVPELTRTIGNDTYYGAWIQYMHPRAW